MSSKYFPLGPPSTQPRRLKFEPGILTCNEVSPTSSSDDSSPPPSSELILTNEELLREYDVPLEDGEVSPGQVIIASPPFVFVPSTSTRGLRCEYCFCEKGGQVHFFHCPACKYPVYCSQACAEKDRMYHQDECRIFENNKRLPSSETVRFVLRFLLKMRRDGWREADIVPNGESRIYRRFVNLLDHFDDILQSSNRRHILENSYSEIINLMGKESAPTPEYFLEVYGRMAINSFHISDKATQDTLGSGLYLGPSIMNHSCIPTASVSFEGRNIIVRSLVSMPKIDFSKVFISYVDLMESKEHRRLHLERNYYFLCQCSRCLDDKFESSMFSLKCPHCNSGKKGSLLEGCVPIGRHPDIGGSFRCMTCKEITVHSEVMIKDYLEAFEIVEEYLEQEGISLNVSKFCIKLMDMNNFHPLHIAYIKAQQYLFENWWDEWRQGRRKGISTECENNLVEDIATCGQRLIWLYEKYSLHTWNYEGIILGKLAVAENHLKKVNLCREHLNKSNRILYLTMGEIVSIEINDE